MISKIFTFHIVLTAGFICLFLGRSQSAPSINLLLDKTEVSTSCYSVSLGVYNKLTIEIKEGNYEKALEYLYPITAGEVAASASHLVMAMRRVAWINHQQGNRIKAFQAYRELAEFTHIESQKLICQVECLGLLMELAESGKGSHLDVRKEAYKLYTSLPVNDYKNQALVELIFMESFARQPQSDFASSSQLGEEFISKYEKLSTEQQNSIQREFSAGMFQTAMFYVEVGNDKRASELYSRVLNEFSEDVDHFKGIHPHAQALVGLSNIARKSGDITESNKIRQNVIQNYSEDFSAQRIDKIYPWLKSAQLPAVICQLK